LEATKKDHNPIDKRRAGKSKKATKRKAKNRGRLKARNDRKSHLKKTKKGWRKGEEVQPLFGAHPGTHRKANLPSKAVWKRGLTQAITYTRMDFSGKNNVIEGKREKTQNGVSDEGGTCGRSIH